MLSDKKAIFYAIGGTAGEVGITAEITRPERVPWDDWLGCWPNYGEMMCQT